MPESGDNPRTRSRIWSHIERSEDGGLGACPHQESCDFNPSCFVSFLHYRDILADCVALAARLAVPARLSNASNAARDCVNRCNSIDANHPESRTRNIFTSQCRLREEATHSILDGSGPVVKICG